MISQIGKTYVYEYESGGLNLLNFKGLESLT
uniref:Uncharacterized protein n=1 Tax=Anguilla anguilla TaxID=7936 RepID=A0A0E9TH28_ANGAN